MRNISGRRSAPSAGSPFVPDAGDIVWLENGPTEGTEQDGHRPAVVISPHAYNARARLCFACPITSRVRGWPFEVALPAGLRTSGVVMTDRGRSSAFAERRASFIERVPPEVLDEVRVLIGSLLEIPTRGDE